MKADVSSLKKNILFSPRDANWGVGTTGDLNISPFTIQVQEVGHLVLYEINNLSETWHLAVYKRRAINTAPLPLQEKHKKWDTGADGGETLGDVNIKYQRIKWKGACV